MDTRQLIVHAAIVVVALVCYTVLTALGDDGTPILAAGLGWGGGALGGSLVQAKAGGLGVAGK